MKKFFTILAGILLLAACAGHDHPVEINYQLTATIDIMRVVSYIKDIDGSMIYDNGELMYKDDHIVLSYMLYDKSGNLVANENVKPKSFSEKATITKSVKEGEYTIVVYAYLGDNDLEWWSPMGTDNLNNFKIKFYSNKYYLGSLSCTLGFYKETISINKSENLSISVPPAVSFVVLNFQNLSAKGISTVELGIKTWNDFLNAADGKANLVEQVNYLVWDLPKGADYSNLLTWLFYLPTSSYTIVWQGLNANGAKVTDPFSIPSRAIVAGKTYHIMVDTSSGQTTISEL